MSLWFNMPFACDDADKRAASTSKVEAWLSPCQAGV